MLVHAYNHLIPSSNGAPTVLSSPTTSTYIPDIPSDDLSRPHPHHSVIPRVVHSSRRDRRMSSAPYPNPLSINASSVHTQRFYHKGISAQHNVFLHSPRPVPFFNPVQAFDNAMTNAHVQSPLAFAPGAHGTIINPFDKEHFGFPNAVFDELTATQMARLQASNVSAQGAPSSLHAPSVSTQMWHNHTFAANPSFPQIQVPQVPSIPQVPAGPPPSSCSTDLDASARRPSEMPYLPDAIPPETSQLHIKTSGKLVPPSDTFPTPVELLGELSIRDAEAAQRDRRRVERRKAQLVHETERLGFTPTDPDTISTHDKKRLYLDCLEQYVIYLHKQLRLAGHEPVPMERVSSGRGLTSRSIRTMIVHLKNTTAKLHAERREAEIKYDELRAQLGADADMTALSFMASNAFMGISTCAPKTGVHDSIRTSNTGPQFDSSSNVNRDEVNRQSNTISNTVDQMSGAGRPVHSNFD
ncbi:hypothetical protein ACEPAI_630 [Sanghuangporus weigelae]